jgi:hypothetical protein
MQTPTNPIPSRRSRRRRLALVLGTVLSLALLAAACGGGDDSASAGGASPTVAISSPTDGATVGREFEVELDVNFPIGAPDTGRDHVHLYYDGNRAEGEYGIAYAKTFTVTGLAPGQHEIEAVVAHADHSTTDAHSDPITVTVTDSDTGAATSGTTATTSGDDGYDY